MILADLDAFVRVFALHWKGSRKKDSNKMIES